MRKFLAAVLLTAIALLGPATSAHADPPPPPIVVTTLWPVCGTVLGTWICIPP